MNQHKSPRQVPQPLEHDYGVTPGEIIRFELKARGLTQADLAARAGTSAKHLNQVIQDAVPLSADTALRLERTLGIPATVLTQADGVNQANKQRAKVRETLTDHHTWFAKFPKAALTELKIVTAKSSLEAQIEDLLIYLGVADPDAYDTVYGDGVLSFRRAQRWKANPYATALWLRSAELKAEDLDVAPYDKAAFTDLLDELPELTLLPIGQAFPLLQARCANVGVAVVYNPSIDGTRTSAAIRWLGPERPVIALAERGQFEDSLWFGFFHEAGHVLLHPRRKSVIELDGADDEDGAETDADNFAKKTILRGRRRELMKLETREQIKALSKELNIHPGLAAAIRAYDTDKDALRFASKDAWRIASKLRRRLDVSVLP
jgi:HTH-type transcriptional regulator/antitoxin HigA